MKESRDQYNLTPKKFSEKKLTQERLRISLDGIVAQASENQHLELASISSLLILDDNAAQSLKMTRLKSSVDQLGAINMMALEEFEQAGIGDVPAKLDGFVVV